MQDSPSARAANAVYQSIGLNSNDNYREQAIELLKDVVPKDTDVNMPRLISALRFLSSE